MPELELEHRNHRTEIRVAAPFTVAVDRSLHLSRAALDSRYRVGYRKLRVVMSVNAQRNGYAAFDQCEYFGEPGSQSAAICIAENYPVGACSLGCQQRLERIVRICGEAIEEMFGVINYFASL